MSETSSALPISHPRPLICAVREAVLVNVCSLPAWSYKASSALRRSTCCSDS
eukprot:IDg11722t1